MLLLLSDEHKVKLINKILLVGSQEEVKGVIDNAVQLLNKDRLNDETIAGFFKGIIGDL